MLTARRAQSTLRARSPTSLTAMQNGPNHETTMVRARSPSASSDSEHSCFRCHHRTPSTAACCSCTRHRRCGTDPQTRCDCREAGRRCYNCDPRDKCQNCLCTDAPITTGLLDPVNGLLCLPVAETPACRRRTQATLLTGTAWVFNAPANPESQNTQTTLLTQALSQESEGTGSSTHHGSQPPTSP